MPHVCSSNQRSRELQLCLQEAGEVSSLHISQSLFSFSHKHHVLISTRGATSVYSGRCTYSHLVLKTRISCFIYGPLEGLMDIVCLLSRKRHTPILCVIPESQYSNCVEYRLSTLSLFGKSEKALVSYRLNIKPNG